MPLCGHGNVTHLVNTFVRVVFEFITVYTDITSRLIDCNTTAHFSYGSDKGKFNNFKNLLFIFLYIYITIIIKPRKPRDALQIN